MSPDVVDGFLLASLPASLLATSIGSLLGLVVGMIPGMTIATAPTAPAEGLYLVSVGY